MTGEQITDAELRAAQLRARRSRTKSDQDAADLRDITALAVAERGREGASSVADALRVSRQYVYKLVEKSEQA